MSFEIQKNLTIANFNPRGTTPQWIVIHNTANGTSQAGTAYNNTQYFKNINRDASAHYFIDDEEGVIWQCVEDTNTAWHCGDGSSQNGCYNSNSIGIEVCEPSDGRFTDYEIQKLTWLVQELMNEYGIPAERVCRHNDVTGKRCPWFYADNEDEWEALHAQITAGSAEPQQPQQQADTYEWLFDVNSQKWGLKLNGNWVYDRWAQVDGKWYAINKQGWLITQGWYKEGDYWYYLDKQTGEMKTGWLWDELNQGWYYLDENGRLVQDGWKWDEDTQGWYYLKSDGKMATKEYVHAPQEVSRYWTNENGKWQK